MLIEDNTSYTLDTKIRNRYDMRTNYNNDPANYPFTYRAKNAIERFLGASYIIAGKALISADVDYVGLSSIRFSTDQGQ